VTHVSVVIPTHNRAGLLAAAVGSVLHQATHGHTLEVIVIDDGSTDDTPQVLRQFGDRIVTVVIPSSGRPAVPRNVGLRRATGELVAFQDSDDLWAADRLLQQVALFDDPAVGLAYGNATVIDPAGCPTGALVIDPERAVHGSCHDELLRANVISTLTVMARRQALLDLGGFDEDPGLRGVEDYELWLRLSTRWELAYLDATLASYRSHPGNLSDVTRRRLAQAHLDLARCLSGPARVAPALRGLAALTLAGARR
jgi:glycosyltransferase involved in cell wall biosynthesis